MKGNLPQSLEFEAGILHSHRAWSEQSQARSIETKNIIWEEAGAPDSKSNTVTCVCTQTSSEARTTLTGATNTLLLLLSPIVDFFFRRELCLTSSWLPALPYRPKCESHPIVSRRAFRFGCPSHGLPPSCQFYHRLGREHRLLG